MPRFVLASLVALVPLAAFVPPAALADTLAPSGGPDEGPSSAASVYGEAPDSSGSPRAAGYTVRGRRYHLLDSAVGFRERGTASWYGERFHGRQTASGEPFDMHALTAAHPHLPLQSVVRVSAVGTGASVIVRINDRGPFADERVIDLSRAAARQLGMLESGTAEVTIEALDARSAGEVSGETEDEVSDGAVSTEAGTGRSDTPPAVDAGTTFIQVGAFAERANADALVRRVRAHVSSPAGIDHDAGRALYRVRVGPIGDAPSRRRVLESLATIGIDGHTVRVPVR